MIGLVKIIANERKPVEFYDPKRGDLMVVLDTTSPKEEGRILMNILKNGINPERILSPGEERGRRR